MEMWRAEAKYRRGTKPLVNNGKNTIDFMAVK